MIKSFIDNAGGHTNSAIWQEVTSISGVWLDPRPEFHEGGGVKITVSDSAKFSDTLKNNGYAINVWYEMFGTHGNTSAREITNSSWETGMHLANDDPTNSNLFLVHWDKRSTEFKQRDPRYWTRLGEQKDAGNSHYEPFSASQVRERLRQRGIVPDKER